MPTKTPVIKFTQANPPPVKFQSYCEIVFRDKDTGGFAKTYAGAGMYMSDPDECRVQALYIRINLTQWRGEQARTVKAALDFYADKKNARYL